MILLSRIIKSIWTSPNEQKSKVIKIRSFQENVEDEQEYEHKLAVEERAEKIIEEAKREAENILSLAHHEANNIRKELEDAKKTWQEIEKPRLIEEISTQAFQSGHEQGLKKGYEEMQESIQFAKDIVQSAREEYHLHIESSEKTILHIGMKVAEKILGKKLSESEEEFLSIVRKAIKEARDYREVQVHVHPVHYGYLVSQKEELQNIFPKGADLFIYPDEDLQETSCIIESSNGRIDASVDSQLEEIKQKLYELLEGE